jgi:timeless
MHYPKASPTMSQRATQLHQAMISLFETELVLDVLLVVGQEMELPENSQYNLLLMEILHHLLKEQDPMAVSRGMTIQGNEVSTTAGTQLPIQRSVGKESSVSALASKLKVEKAHLRTLAAFRHAHFAGTWVQKEGEKRQFISASAAVQQGVVESQSKHLVQVRRKNRMAEPFIGSGKTSIAHTRLPVLDSGPATKRAIETLNKFCKRFVVDCYGPFMKSLKNEFRRDSVRLEESDKVVFFRLIWFFSQWWRASSSSRGKSPGHRCLAEEVIGKLIITMDVFTFNLVINEMESFYNHKKHSRMAQTVALYSEMMHLLHDMYMSKDKIEHEMAMGLIDRLFYGQEALDQIPKLISRWSPASYTREYLCDLVEVIHVSLKLLEANTKKGIEFVKTKGISGKMDVSQKIARMRTIAADFDIKSYFVRKIVSNQMITMYGYIFSQYKVNAPLVNHRIVAMFHRLIRVEIASPDIIDSETPLNVLRTKRSTLQPMLYNLQIFMTVEHILNDTFIRGDKQFKSLIQFSTNLMYKFWAAANANPMLYIECLFRYVSPHRFCELVTNMYVNDDLRMIAERAILLEEHDQLQEEDDDYGETPMNQGQDGEDEEELEFTDDVVSCFKAAPDPNGAPECGINPIMGVSDKDDSEYNNIVDLNDSNQADAEGFTASDSHDYGRKRGREDENSANTSTTWELKKLRVLPLPR